MKNPPFFRLALSGRQTYIVVPVDYDDAGVRIKAELIESYPNYRFKTQHTSMEEAKEFLFEILEFNNECLQQERI